MQSAFRKRKVTQWTINRGGSHNEAPQVQPSTVVVDLAALLEALNLVKGSWQETLEIGAAASAAIAVPFLAMGMSISVDGTN